MQIQSTLIEQVRAVSTTEHQLLEQKLFPYLKDLNNVGDYCLLLKAFYGFIAPVQELIHASIDRRLIPDIDERRTAALILDDLQVLSGDLPDKYATQLPLINNNAAAFGALYVLEGSTLGGKQIAQMVSEQIGITEGLSFFRGYGPETGQKWKNFTQYLEHAENKGSAETVAHTARSTFQLFGTWLDACLHPILR